MVIVIVVVMDAVAMVVTVTAIVMVVIVTVTVIAIVKVAVMVTVVVVAKVKDAQDLQTDAAKENIIAVSHKHIIKRECPLPAFSFYFCNCTYYIITCVEMRCHMLVRLGYVAMSVHLKNASPSQTMTYAQFQK